MSVNTLSRCRFGYPGPMRARRVRRCLVAALASLVIGASGCTGGSGAASSGGDSTGRLPPTSQTSPPGLITVTARDVFGAPAPFAEVTIYANGRVFRKVVADANGRTEVEVNGVWGPYSLAAESTDLYGYLGAPTHSAADRLDFAVTLHPSAAPTGDMMDLAVMSGADSRDEM